MDWCIIMPSHWCPRVWIARHNHLVTLLFGPLIHWDQRPRLRTWEDEGFDMGKSYSSPILHFMIWCIIMLSHWCLRVWALGHTHLGIFLSGPSDYGDGRPRLWTGGGLESSYGKGIPEYHLRSQMAMDGPLRFSFGIYHNLPRPCPTYIAALLYAIHFPRPHGLPLLLRTKSSGDYYVAW